MPPTRAARSAAGRPRRGARAPVLWLNRVHCRNTRSEVMMVNRRVVLRSRPAHVPDRDNFDVVEVDVPDPGPGQALVRNLYFSVEPAIRPRLDGVETYMPPIGLGEPIQSPTLGRVVRSNNPDWQEGDILFGFNNWEDYTLFSGETLLLEHIHPREGVPLSYYVGPLGGSGGAAHFGLHDV